MRIHKIKLKHHLIGIAGPGILLIRNRYRINRIDRVVAGGKKIPVVGVGVVVIKIGA